VLRERDWIHQRERRIVDALHGARLRRRRVRRSRRTGTGSVHHERELKQAA